MIEKIIKKIIKTEGGYVDHPLDRGGPTKYGITRQSLINYLGRETNTQDIKDVTRDDAYEIYYLQYYQTPRINSLPKSLQEIILDMSVNHGPKTAITLLQEVIYKTGIILKIDGKIGPQTLASTDHCIRQNGIKTVINSLVDNRICYYEKIVKHDETQRVFLAGWVKRAESFRQQTVQA